MLHDRTTISNHYLWCFFSGFLILSFTLVVWFCGNIVCRINKVTVHRAGLVLRWVTILGYIVFVSNQATQANSAWPVAILLWVWLWLLLLGIYCTDIFWWCADLSELEWAVCAGGTYSWVGEAGSVTGWELCMWHNQWTGGQGRTHCRHG